MVIWTGAGSPASSYTLVATPVSQGVTFQRGCFTDQSGVIRADPAGTATSASTPLSYPAYKIQGIAPDVKV